MQSYDICVMEINEKLLVIQTEMKAPKGQYNSFGKYSYRKAEDILNAVKPMLKELNCSLITHEQFVQFGTSGVIQSTAILTDGQTGSMQSATAFAGVEKAGGMQLPQAFGSASSYAKKYALGNLLAIDNEEDPDSAAPGGTPKNTPSLPKLTPRDKDKWGKAVAHLTKTKTLASVTDYYSFIPTDLANLKKQAGIS